jgi:ketosteroid isomerase-like protein
MLQADAESDARFAIHAAKTEVREGYNNADTGRILAIFADEFIDLSDGYATFFESQGKAMLRARLESLFRKYEVEMAPTVNEIKISGEIAVEWGWHTLTLRPKDGGPAELQRTRYVEAWTRNPQGEWHISLFIDNPDQKPKLADEVVRAQKR